jgi:signal recognition particle subunit SRP54
LFEVLTERLGSTLASLTGKAKLTEENIQQALRDVRVALLEADVALVVVKEFIDNVRSRALGVEVAASLSPGQVFIKIVNDELVRVMGAGEGGINLSVQPPVVILMAGLQGAGKTTSTAKLAHWLKNKSQKSVMVASADVYRPAAIEQLRTLAEQAQVKFFETDTKEKPAEIAKAALTQAKKTVC